MTTWIKQLFCKHEWDDITKFYSKYKVMCNKCGRMR